MYFKVFIELTLALRLHTHRRTESLFFRERDSLGIKLPFFVLFSSAGFVSSISNDASLRHLIHYVFMI